jgi:hypothetical protein
MTDRESDATLRPGEVAVALPDRADAGVIFTIVPILPWSRRAICRIDDAI